MPPLPPSGDYLMLDSSPAHEAPRARFSFGQFLKRVLGGLYRFVGGFVPKFGDKPFEFVRKLVSLFAVSVMIAGVSYLLNEMIIIPVQYEKQMEFISSIYQPGVSQPLTQEEMDFKYPYGITDDFKKLYYMNNDVRGWLTFQSTEPTENGKPFIDISYPVLYSGNNDFYLDHDFFKASNRNGALFLDGRNWLTYKTRQQSLIIYGHNLSNDQMFTRLNYLVRHSDELYYARNAYKLTFNTLYEQAEYLVFAVMVANTEERDGPKFQYLYTDFESDEAFLQYIADVRARSLYDYNGVDVRVGDELLLLYTCNSKSYAGIDDGRTVVLARKVRPGESSEINKYTIVKNEDVIMPYAWYIHKGLTPHEYYTNGDFVLPDIPTTVPSESTATTTETGNITDTTTTTTQQTEE